ncbi:MAG: Ig-like domain-containing protein, partial [Fibrobacterota bacterium]|nr:Ig-like domain-containing protein [Fibrobacterota bacterium]
MSNPKFSFFKQFFLLLALPVLMLIACHLGQEEKVESNISFNKIVDSLKQYDKVVIVLKDMSGNPIDTVFNNKVEKASDVENLPAPHWNGGKVIVSITGYKDNEVVYHVDSRFDGATNSKDSVIVFKYNGSSVSSPTDKLIMAEGDSLKLPPLSVEPVTLADKAVTWTSSHPEVLLVADGFLKALRPGTSQVIINLNSDPTKTFTITVTIEADGKLPETLSLSAETLYVAINGSLSRLSVLAVPSTATSAVLWHMDDSLTATVTPDGYVKGLKAGVTKLRVQSAVKASVTDSAFVVVSEPVPVESIRFPKDSTFLFVRGAAEILTVEVLPSKANPEVEFTVADPLIVSLKNGAITPLIEGSTTVTATSKENPLKVATLKVRVLPSQNVDSVRITPQLVKLFTGGESFTLTGKVHPASASPRIQWKSSNEDIAKVDEGGKVSPVAPGTIKVYAISLADSTKRDSVDVSVKRDAPVVSVGQDTVVSLGKIMAFLPVVATQEYGLVVEYKWDLDGNLVWDDSSETVKSVSATFAMEKETLVRFYVRDSEGNVTIATKKVRAVKGSVVLITSPANNSYSRNRSISVAWSINGVAQDSLKTEVLTKDGANLITRTARDSAGTAFSTSVTVYLDSIAPLQPNVVGTSPTSLMPRWVWSTGGGGGSGDFRYKLGGDGNPAIGGAETRLLEHALASASSVNTYVLYVQERDSAGNWSIIANLPIKYDLTKPSVAITSPLESGTFITPKAKVKLMGTSGGENAITKVTYEVGGVVTNAIMGLNGAWSTDSISLVDEKTVQVKLVATDVLGNTGEATLSLFRDSAFPLAPASLSSPATPTDVLKATWTWSAGSDGPNGSGLNGQYRFNLNGGAWITTSLTSVLETLTEGSNTFSVQEQDRAGNWSPSANNNVTLDTKAPDAVNFTGTDNLFTRSTQPTWTWKSSTVNPGIGKYDLTLDGPDGSTTLTLSAVTWKADK